MDFVLPFVLAIPAAIVAAAVVAVLATAVAAFTPLSWDRAFFWLASVLGMCALLGGPLWHMATPDPLDRVWVQPLGRLALTEGASFSGAFEVDRAGTFWIVLVGDDEHDAVRRLFREEAQGKNTPWAAVAVPWTIRPSTGPVATGEGRPLRCAWVYHDYNDDDRIVLGSFEVSTAGRHDLQLRVATSMPALVGAAAIVQIRADGQAFKTAGIVYGLRWLLLWCLVGAGLFLLVLALVARSGPRRIGRRAPP